jgi:ankyrin repeat protein
MLLLRVLALCVHAAAVHSAKSSSGIGGLPGEDHYLEKTLPNDLSYAAMIGDVTSARRVISFGVDVNARDREGLTPLLRAVMFENIGVARLLLEHGANASIAGADDYPGGAGIIALHAAAWSGREDIYRLLVEAGADTRALSPDGYSALHRVAASSVGNANHTALWEFMTSEHHVPLDSVSEMDGKSCLHLAAATGVVKFIDAVLEEVGRSSGGDDNEAVAWLVNLQDSGGRTALHIAANRTVYFEPPDVINENITINMITKMAFESQMGMNIMQSLSRGGADPSLPDKTGAVVSDLAEGISTANSELPPKERNPTPAERVAMGLDPAAAAAAAVQEGAAEKLAAGGKKKKKKKKNKRRYDDDFDL